MSLPGSADVLVRLLKGGNDIFLTEGTMMIQCANVCKSTKMGLPPPLQLLLTI